MIEIGQGSILDAQVEAIVNPVNCVGVMGAGLALAIRQQWPRVYEDFRHATTNGLIRIGYIHSSSTGQDRPRLVMHLPTKLHWRDPSRLEWVEAGMRELVEKAAEMNLRSVAIPALGCGLGGLRWAAVEPVIQDALGRASGTKWLVFPPQER